MFRPIFNFSYGRVDSHASAASQTGAGEEFDFLANGRLDAYGLGGSLVLDYERYRPENEIDVELRYTNIYLRSFGGSSTAVQGSADSQSVSLWTRWRAPTGMTLLERPLRYVLEFAHTTFLGDLDGVLGFNYLSSRRHGPRARLERLRRRRDAHAPDGPVQGWRARQGMVGRTGGQFLSGNDPGTHREARRRRMHRTQPTGPRHAPKRSSM